MPRASGAREPETVMAKSRDPFFKALDNIRERARAGGYAPGQSIVIVEEARRLDLSTTPVREALAWLCGEGLIERGPAGGFLAARLDAGAVRDRYDLRLAYLSAALDLTAGLPAYGRSPPRDGAAVTDLVDLFESLVRRTGNGALLDAYHRVDGQLTPFRSAERRIFADLDAEADDLLELAATRTNGDLREGLRAYHFRRGRSAALLSMDVAGHPGGEGGEDERP